MPGRSWPYPNVATHRTECCNRSLGGETRGEKPSSPIRSPDATVGTCSRLGGGILPSTMLPNGQIIVSIPGIKRPIYPDRNVIKTHTTWSSSRKLPSHVWRWPTPGPKPRGRHNTYRRVWRPARGQEPRRCGSVKWPAGRPVGLCFVSWQVGAQSGRFCFYIGPVGRPIGTSSWLGLGSVGRGRRRPGPTVHDDSGSVGLDFRPVLRLLPLLVPVFSLRIV